MKKFGKALVDFLAAARGYLVARWRFGKALADYRIANRQADRARRKRWRREIREASNPPPQTQRRRPF